MKKTVNILLKPFNNRVFYKNNIFEWDNGNNIFFSLKSKLSNYGININTIDLKGVEPDVYIYCDLPYPWDFKWWADLVTHPEKNILIIFESSTINPFNHWKFLYRFFKYVYTWDPTAVDGLKVFEFRIPQTNYKKPRFTKKRKTVGAVLSNKNTYWVFRLLSKYKVDFYKERWSLISYLDKVPNLKFDLYGRYWNKVGDKYVKGYKGSPPDNSQIYYLSRYKFAVTIENSSAPGYVSEKIIDCIKAKTVPLYLGAPDVQNYIPSNSFVDIRKFENWDGLVKFITTIDKKTYQELLNAGQRFLYSKEYKNNWNFESFVELIIKTTGTTLN